MSDSVSTRASDDGRPSPTGRSSGVPVDTGLHIPAAAVEAAKREFWASAESLGEPEDRNFESAIRAALEVMGIKEGRTYSRTSGVTSQRFVSCWTAIEEPPAKRLVSEEHGDV